jgi:putative ABC transport system permease protein
MWRLTLAQMRRSLGRLTAAGIAIAIGTAFVAATLLAGSLMQRISYDSIMASYGQADLIARTPEAVTEASLEAVRALPGVAAADPRVVLPWVALSSGGRELTQTVIPTPSDPAFDTQEVTAGALPAQEGEIALPERAAERLEVGVGDPLTVTYYAWVPAEPGATAPADAGATEPDGADATADPDATDPDAAEPADAGATADATADAAAPAGSDPSAAEPEGEYRERTQEVTVVGLTTDPRSAWAQSDGAATATTADTLVWSGWSQVAGEPRLVDADVRQVLVATAAGADTADVQDAVAGVLASGGQDAQVMTRDRAAEYAISGNDTGPILVVVLAFAAVALLVAGLVIANTFQVLVAQRTRTLALLRCVGAVRAQVRRSVLLEAVLVGLASSVAGVLLGTALVQVALWVLQGQDLPFPVPSVVRPTAASVLVPLAVGVVVTVLAALTPARIATRVAPIAALRPADAPAVGSRAGRLRLVLSLLLVVGGGVLMAGGVALSRSDELTLAVGLAVLGGGASFVGLLVSAVLWMPKVVAAIGRLVGRAGMPARLAAANTGRNPARTAATSTALLIGVTLVAMMSTGAVTARATLGGELDTRYPVDMQLSTPTTVAADGTVTSEPLPAATFDRVAALDGVAAAATLPADQIVLDTGAGAGPVPTIGLEPEQAAQILRDADVARSVAEGTVVLGEQLAKSHGIADGDTVPVVLADPATGGARTDGATVDLTATVTALGDWTALVTPDTLDRLGSAGVTSTAWIRLDDVGASGRVLQDVQDVTADTALDISGAALERASYQRAIDTMLAIVVGLLAVAVVIALIGVTNTLSLSVIERRRESATLRALGLTRRQLRSALAVEGALIAGVGAVVGVLLGLAYGWLGSTAVLGGVAVLELRVPWTDMALVLAVALVAGVLASVVPGRSAARTPPVAALAVD